MALLPAGRNSTLSRPGSQPPARGDPFAESGDLDQRMGQLMSGASGGGRQPPVRGWAPLADLSETDEAYLAEAGLPGVARDDIGAGLAGQELVIGGEYGQGGQHGRALRRGGARAGPGTGCCCPARPTRTRTRVTAALAGGVLTVTVPKAEAGKPHRIQITAG